MELNENILKKKNLVFLFFLILLFSMAGLFSRTTVYPVSEKPLDQNANVVLLSTTWCGYCAKTRRFFEANNIQYTEFDVENNRKGASLYNAIGGGGVPIVKVDDQWIRGYAPQRILKLLEI